jgi:hypothetical protein
MEWFHEQLAGLDRPECAFEGRQLAIDLAVT